MPRKRHTPEQIIGKLREAEVDLASGQTVLEVCRTLRIAEQTYYRWRKEYGGLKVEHARRFEELERENLHPHGLRRASAWRCRTAFSSSLVARRWALPQQPAIDRDAEKQCGDQPTLPDAEAD